MNTFIHRWIFWLRAKSRHGIHSPFVYRFLEDALYRKDLKGLPPQKRLLLAACRHFQPATLGPGNGACAAWVLEQCPGLRQGEAPVDLAVFDQPGGALSAWLQNPAHYHNDTAVYVGKIRETRESNRAWREAAALPGVRVVLETYGAGLLFFRQQQAGQYFKIRN